MLILVIAGWDISSEIVLKWLSVDPTDYKSIESIKTTSIGRF